MSFEVSPHPRTLGTLSECSPPPTSGKLNYIVPENKCTCLLALVESSLLSFQSSQAFQAFSDIGSNPWGPILNTDQPLLPVCIIAFCHMTSYLISQGSISFPFI